MVKDAITNGVHVHVSCMSLNKLLAEFHTNKAHILYGKPLSMV
jgi:hypothetical protein